MNDWEELTPSGNIYDAGSSQTSDGAPAPEELVSSGNIYDNMDNAETFTGAEDYRQGPLSAARSSVDMIKSSIAEWSDRPEEAVALYKEAQKYVPGITWEEVVDNPTLIGKLTSGAQFIGGEVVPQLAPYLAPTAAGIVAAPFTGGSSLGATVTTGLAALSQMAQTFGTTSGNIMTEQRMAGQPIDKTRALTAGALVAGLDLATMKNPAVKGLVLNSPLLKGQAKQVVAKGALEATEEVTATTAGLAIEQVIGRDMTFSQAMENFDEALVSSMGARGALTAPAYTNRLVKGEKPREQLVRERDAADDSGVLLMLESVKEGSTPESMSAKVDELWTSREFQNSSEAAIKLSEYGAELTPSALDIDVSTGLTDSKGRPVTDNLAKAFGINTTMDKFGKFLSERFNIPLVGRLIDPTKDYNATLSAQKKMYDDWSNTFNTALDGSVFSAKEKKAITRDVNNYINGYANSLSVDTKAKLARFGDMEVFDGITVQKRARQMTEKMNPKGAGEGTTAGVLASVGEGLLSGGIPIITPTLGAGAAIGAAGINATQKAKMARALETDPKIRAEYEAAVQALQALYRRVEAPQELEEKVKEATAVDMGAMELMK